MQITNVPFAHIDWEAIPPTVHPGETGTAYWRTLQLGQIRVRKVEYSSGYVADHWCRKGHILTVLEGTLQTELADGRTFTLTAGSSYVVEDEHFPHRSIALTGAKLFIVD